MSELQTISQAHQPNTVESMVREFSALGIQKGDCLIVHSSLSSMGWVCGGAVAVIQALLELLGPGGTLVMPAHTAVNTDPSYWENPPVPQEWWPIIRNTMPAFDPAITPTNFMGCIPETFRKWPGTLRSNHPVSSFCARGAAAEKIVEGHALESYFGKASPLEKLYAHNAKIVLLGVGHDRNTSLHLAETRARFGGNVSKIEGSAILIDGKRSWKTYSVMSAENDDFISLGEDFEKTEKYCEGKVGNATTKVFSQRALVDFAVGWMERTRP